MEKGIFALFYTSLLLWFGILQLLNFDLAVSLLAVFLLAALIHLYGVWPLLQLRHIPGPPAKMFSGHMMEMWIKQMHLFLQEHARTYGKVYRCVLGRRPVVVVADPDIARQVFVDQFKDDFHSRPTQGSEIFGQTKHLFIQQGDDWRASRRALQPSFNTQNLGFFAEEMNKAGRDFVDRLDDVKDGEDINIWRWFGQLTMQVISATSFGVAVSQKDPGGNPLVEACITVLNDGAPNNNAVIYYLNVFPFLMKVLAPLRKCSFSGTTTLGRIMNAMNTIGEKTDAMADSLRKGTEDNEKARRSFLNLLINAKDKETGKRMDAKEIRDQSFLFILAGYETTANTLAYASYLLAAHPDKMEKVLEEIDSLCADDQDITYKNMKDFVYLDYVIQETLRLYPPAAFVSRQAQRDTKVSKYDVPKGTNILISTYGIHHDERIYAEPEKFVPERWDPQSDESQHRHKYAWIPFGEGPRKCIGYRFALEEMKIVLARVLQKYTFELSSRCSHPLKTRLRLMLSPVDGIFLNPVPRR